MALNQPGSDTASIQHHCDLFLLKIWKRKDMGNSLMGLAINQITMLLAYYRFVEINISSKEFV
jgi:hypothetical protein